MDDKLLGVQFLHPGPERKPDDIENNLRRWNTDDQHYRKFMRSPGRVLDRATFTAGGKPRKSDLAFWGEWEPPSRATALPRSTDRTLPRYLHTPFFDSALIDDTVRINKKRHNPQNTDPFVFGPRFRYTICMQSRGKRMAASESGEVVARPTQLARMLPDSLILFGSSVGKRFVLDTVFVVDDFVNWGADYPVIDDGTDPDGIYRDSTILKLTAGSPLRLYNGVHYKDRRKHRGMFSFVPCMPANGDTPRFARPSLDIDGVAHGKTQGYSFSSHGLESTVQLWNTVTDQLLEQGFSLGVEIAMPARTGSGPAVPRRGGRSTC